MQILKQEQISPCEVEMEIQVPAERVGTEVESVYAELAKVTDIPGFRKGKAPRELLKRYVDEAKVKDRVEQRLSRDAYNKAIDEAAIEPFAPASLEVVKLEFGEPYVFKVRVPLAPKVELGNYIGLEVERTVPAIQDEQVDNEIERIWKENTEFKVINDRPVQKEDSVVIDITYEDDPHKPAERRVVRVGETLPDFDNGLIGMNIDEEKTIQVKFPDDYEQEEMRGKTTELHVKVVEINEPHLPELTDEWVKKTFVGELEEGKEAPSEAIDTVEKLKARIRGALEKAAVDVADAQVRNKIVEKILENSKVDFPRILVDDEIDERINGLIQALQRRSLTLDDYLKHTKQSIEELRESYAEDATRTITMSLVFHNIIEREGIKVTDEDIEQEIRSMAEERRVPVETMKAYIDRTESLPSISNRLLHKKVMDFLVSASNIKNVGQ
jgi:trigger factor